MGIKGKIVVVMAAAIIGYVIGRGDGRDIAEYNAALDRIANLESDNKNLSDQVVKLKSQAASTTAALNARSNELESLKKKRAEEERSLSNAAKHNAAWASQPVPSAIADVLRTSSDSKGR